MRGVPIFLCEHPKIDRVSLASVDAEFERRKAMITRPLAARFGVDVCVLWAVASSIMAHHPVSAPPVSDPLANPAVIRAWINGYFAFTTAAASVPVKLTRTLDGPIHDVCEFLAFSGSSPRIQSELITLKFFWDAHIRKGLLGGYRMV